MSEVDIVRRDKSVSVTLATTTSSASTVRLEDAAGAIDNQHVGSLIVDLCSIEAL